MRETAASVLRFAPTIAMLGVLVAAGWLAARWFVYFAAPAEVPPTPPRERVQLAATAQRVADAHLFGMAPARPGGEALTNLNIKLKGVFAGSPSGLAILNAGERDQATRVGAEIVPGVVLEQVHARHVLLRRNGVLERVNIEERTQLAAAAPAGPTAARRTRTRPVAEAVPAPAPPPPTPAARYQRPEPYAPVGDVPTEPASGAAGGPPPTPLAAPPMPAGTAARGLVVTSVPSGGMLERLGLQPGDVIRSVNGEAVATEADVARIVQSRGLQGTFTAEVQRGGATVPITVNPQR